MIIKSLTTKSNKGMKALIRYMIRSKDRNHNDPFFLHNLSGKNLEEWIAAFINNESDRKRTRRNSVRAYHDILSFAPGDTKALTERAFTDLVAKYIELRCPDALVLGVIHRQAHVHVHLCISGVAKDSGEVIRISKAEFRNIQKAVQAYQIEHYPELVHSLPAFGSRTRSISTPELKWMTRTGLSSIRTQIKHFAHGIYESSTSIPDFLERLRSAGLSTYTRGGKAAGIVHNEKKYRFSKLGLELGRIREKEGPERQ